MSDRRLSTCSENKPLPERGTESAAEVLARQFAAWEVIGRGWDLSAAPVPIEPPCQPFSRAPAFQDAPLDDAREHSLISGSMAKVGGWFRKAVQHERRRGKNPQCDTFRRGNVVEIQVSLPSMLTVSKAQIEQLILATAYGTEPISFELIGTQKVIVAQFATGERDASRFEEQLAANTPDAVLIRQNGFLESEWQPMREDFDTASLVIEFGLAREFFLPLAIVSNLEIDPFIGIIAALSNLERGELGLYQVIFQKLGQTWRDTILQSVADHNGDDLFANSPELGKEVRSKTSRPLFAAVVRVAVQTKSDDRTLELAKALAGALTVFANPTGNELLPLDNPDYPSPAHVADTLLRQSRRRGMILNSDELISLVHLPSASVRVPKFKRETQKTKAAPNVVLRADGLLLGTNTHAGRTAEVRLSAEQRMAHTWLCGGTGVGKSTLLYQFIQQDIDNGQGIAVIDPHGDLIEKVLGSIPKNRIQDVVLVDPSDQEYSVGFNVLSAHSELERNLLASDLISVFERQSRSWGDQMGVVLSNGLMAFLESSQGGTLADLQRFLIEPKYRNEFLTTVQDTQVLYYWKKVFPQLAGNKSIGPVLTRLSGFLDKRAVRCMVTQKKNHLDFAKIMDTGKIFLAKLAQGQIGNENASLLGSFFVSKFQMAAMSRQAQSATVRKDFFLYIDEFHNVMTPSMAHILNGARKYRLGLILAHQELTQLQTDPTVASAVFSNPYARICFRVGDDDARKLANGFASFDGKDIQKLPNFQALCRVERADCDFNLSILPPPATDEAVAAETRRLVIAASREKYAVHRTKLEQEQAIHFENEIEPSPPSKGAIKRTSEPSEPAPPEPTGLTQVRNDIGPVVEVHAAASQKTTPELGRGGHQHKSIQERLQREANGLGFTASVECQLAGGSTAAADLILRKADMTMAVEISVTTTTDHEFGNIRKCLAAGFTRVAVVSPGPERLKAIAIAVHSGLDAQARAKVCYFTPDELITELKRLSEVEGRAEPKPRVVAGWKVRREGPELSTNEQKTKESAAIHIIAEAMKSKP